MTWPYSILKKKELNISRAKTEFLEFTLKNGLEENRSDHNEIFGVKRYISLR